MSGAVRFRGFATGRRLVNRDGTPRVCLVSGAAGRGIGRACELRMASEGATVAVADLPGRMDALEGVAAEVEAESEEGRSGWQGHRDSIGRDKRDALEVLHGDDRARIRPPGRAGQQRRRVFRRGVHPGGGTLGVRGRAESQPVRRVPRDEARHPAHAAQHFRGVQERGQHVLGRRHYRDAGSDHKLHREQVRSARAYKVRSRHRRRPGPGGPDRLDGALRETRRARGRRRGRGVPGIGRVLLHNWL